MENKSITILDASNTKQEKSHFKGIFLINHSPQGIILATNSLIFATLHKTHQNIHFVVLIYEDIAHSGDLNPEFSPEFERRI